MYIEQTTNITVSGYNYEKLVRAAIGSKIIVGHIGSNVTILLTKTKNIYPRKKMTIEEIEEALGYGIELVIKGG